jgi:DNA-binding NtrC family response regulator
LKFGQSTKQILKGYDFPGNIRELENAVHRAAILCKSKTIEPEHLPDEIVKENAADIHLNIDEKVSFKEAKEKVVTDFERNYLQQILVECEGVISKAAERMGMHTKNLHEKLNKYGINPK